MVHSVVILAKGRFSGHQLFGKVLLGVEQS